MLEQIDVQIPTDTLKYQGCLEEPNLAISAHCGGGAMPNGESHEKFPLFLEPIPE